MLASVLKLGSRRAMGCSFSPRIATRSFGSFNKDPAQQVGIFLIYYNIGCGVVYKIDVPRRI